MVSHNIPPAYNWERFQEAHEFIVKAWTTSGPFRWEGKHYHYRYVNPWVKPYQKPHPPIWLPGVVSRDSLRWAAEKRIPYIMLATKLDPTRQAFQLYHERAAELGYKSGPQNIGYPLERCMSTRRRNLPKKRPASTSRARATPSWPATRVQPTWPWPRCLA